MYRTLDNWNSTVLDAKWSLLPQVARKLICTWGSPSLDLFATHLNAKLPLYCSLIADPQAVFEDAFRHPWNDLDTYAFPSFYLVERVLAWVKRDPKSLDDSDRPSLAGESVVCRPSPPDPTTSKRYPSGIDCCASHTSIGSTEASTH